MLLTLAKQDAIVPGVRVRVFEYAAKGSVILAFDLALNPKRGSETVADLGLQVRLELGSQLDQKLL